MKRKAWGVFCLFSGLPFLAGAFSTELKTVDYSRFVGEAEVPANVRAAGNLSGNQTAKDKNRTLGTFEYDFSVPVSDWYEISIPHSYGVEFEVDGKFYGVNRDEKNLLSIFLEKGKHTLMIRKRNWFHPWGKVDKVSIRTAGTAPEERLLLTGQHFVHEAVIRVGGSYRLDVMSGMKKASVLEALVKDDAGRIVDTVRLALPASENNRATLTIPAKKEGFFKIGFKLDGKEISSKQIPSFSLVAIEAKTPVTKTGSELKKRLIQEIDCAAKAPDYFGGGATRVVRKSFGAYRESGDVSWLSHMNSTEPSWFAYKMILPEDQQQYLYEIDYPDDGFRTYAISIRNGGDTSYPAAAGVETGHEYPVSNKMRTHTILSWAKSKDTRLVIANACDGQRGAAAKIRIYKVEDKTLPSLVKNTKNTRDFSNWYEEGSGFVGLYGGDYRNKNARTFASSADRWAETMAYMGCNVLYPTLMVYQFGLNPSDYNLFATRDTTDLAEIILLKAEKYGLQVLFDFHPEVRELKYFADKENQMRNREGHLSSFAPMHGPLHPRNQEWLFGLVSEFVNRYKHSPAFKGLSLRHMTWYNHALVNFNDLSWGYDDYTVRLFEKETGIRVPGGMTEPNRYAKRYEFLAEQNREKWVAWRCRKIADLYAKLAKIVQTARPDLILMSDIFVKEGGIDSSLLKKIDGVVLNDSAVYGRRGRGENNRSDLLKKMLSPNKDISQFLSSASYFEATGKVILPVDLGFGKDVKATWMSAVVNPSGRLYLERFALALARTDAKMLGDGGNAYTLGQPELREFLIQYRALPNSDFVLRSDAAEVAAVRTNGNDFYVVNMMPFPVKTIIDFGKNTTVSGMADGKKYSLKNGKLEVNPAAFELMTFRAQAPIRSITTEIPAAERQKMESQLAAIRESLGSLSKENRDAVEKLAVTLEKMLKEQKYWSFRIHLELADSVLKKAGILPPYYYNDGYPVTPAGALAAKELQGSAQGNSELVPSSRIIGDWTTENVLVSRPGEPLKLHLKIPATGEYRIQAGYVSGAKYGTLTVKSGGKTIGIMRSSGRENTVRTILLPAAVGFRAGIGELEFIPAPGTSAALSYVLLTPAYTVIPPMRWKVSDAYPKQSMDNVLEPEKTKDYSKWTKLKGFDVFTDISCGLPKKDGNIRYAVTYIDSPDARRVRICYGLEYRAKMWLNGVAVKPTDARSTSGAPVRGEEILDLELKKGWNEFLIKVSSGSNGFGFWMEISNLSDLKFSTEPKDAGKNAVELPVGGKVLHHQDFERKMTQTKETGWDGSGKESFLGKGTSQMGHYFGGAKEVEPGKTYVLQAYVRGVKDGLGAHLQINWNRANGKLVKYDLSCPKVTTEWQRFQLKAKAPEGAASAFLIIGNGRNREWVDEVWFGEVPESAKEINKKDGKK